MLRGALSGGIWGLVLGGLLLALTSQLADWRDLRPALTSESIREETLADAPSEAPQEPPVVTSGQDLTRPQAVDTPAIVPDGVPDAPTSGTETTPPATPSSIVVASEVAVPERPSEATPGLPGAEDTTIALALPDAALSDPRPGGDVAPAGIEITAPDTPARLAPKPQIEIAAQMPPGGEGTADQAMAPEVVVLPLDPARPVVPVEDFTATDLEDTPAISGDVFAAPEAADVSGGGASVDAFSAPELPAPESAPEADVSVASVTELPQAPGTPTGPDAVSEIGLAPVPKAVETPSEARVEAPVAVAPSIPGSLTSEGPDNPDSGRLAEAADPAPTTLRPQVNRIGAQAEEGPGSGVRIRRLPVRTDPEPDVSETVDGDVEESEAAVDQNLALRRNSIEFVPPEGATVMAVVLVHTGDAISGEIGVPVTFAVPSDLNDAGEIARGYRASGHEVVLIPALPPRATAQDVDVTLSLALEAVPDAVALLDADGEGFQASRDATAQVIAMASETGHGVVTIRRGFNNAARLAGSAGVATGEILREIDPDETDPAVIGRDLDQAAIRARNGGGIVVLGRTSPGHLDGIRAWVDEAAGRGIAIAPLSMVLLDE